jgi:sortase A
VGDIKKQILSRVSQRGTLQAKHHVQSLLFGIGLGCIALMLLLMGFFNERFIAPFITPSKAVSNTPIIIDPNDTVAPNDTKVIIPKINVEIPVVYDEPSIEEHAIQNALERGVVHYATTPNPGEQGNAVLFGHSSNNILNKGKYKFAFVLLNRLDEGDTFMLTHGGKRYVYRVYGKKIVKPTEVGVLGAAAKPNSATLITCDPPGTSINRLVVTGEQITPDPAANVASKTAPPTAAAPADIPSNAPTLWNRLTSWL